MWAFTDECLPRVYVLTRVLESDITAIDSMTGSQTAKLYV